MTASTQISHNNGVKDEERVYYSTLDLIRLFLAIQVVAIHSGAFSTVFINPVPAFLAIGGFVVYGSIERNSVRQFFINRGLRLLPLLFVSFLAVCIAYDFEAMKYNILYWLFPFGDPPVNPVVWSLMYEEFFYCLLVLFFIFGIYKYKWVPFALAGLTGFLAWKGFYFGLPAHFFVLGCAFFIGNLAYIYRKTLRRIPRWVSTILFFVCLFYTYQVPYTSAAFPGRLLGDFASFFAMLLFTISGPQFPRLKFDLSYSIYLIHCLVLAQLVYFIPLGTERLFWIMLLTTLPISYACWFLIEKPALELRHRFSHKKNKQIEVGVSQGI